MLSISVPVEKYITPDPVVATEAMGIDELQRLMTKHNIRHLPVVREHKVVGIITDRDVRLVSGLSAAEKYQVQARDLMALDPLMFSVGTPLEDVAQAMAERKIGGVIVNDPDGALLGIFTATDALKALIEMIHKAPRTLTP